MKFPHIPKVNIEWGISPRDRTLLGSWVMDLVETYQDLSSSDKVDLCMYITDELLSVGHRIGYETSRVDINEEYE